MEGDRDGGGEFSSFKEMIDRILGIDWTNAKSYETLRKDLEWRKKSLESVVNADQAIQVKADKDYARALGLKTQAEASINKLMELAQNQTGRMARAKELADRLNTLNAEFQTLEALRNNRIQKQKQLVLKTQAEASLSQLMELVVKLNQMGQTGRVKELADRLNAKFQALEALRSKL